MINMRYFISNYIILMLFFAGNDAYGQSMEILFQGSSVTLVSAHSIPDIDLNVAKTEQPLFTLFDQYYYPRSLEAYKSIFYDGHYPTGIEDHYDVWRKNMEGVNIQLTGLLHGLYKGFTTSILNFNFIKDGITIRLSFFAKLIDGKWYPYEAAELMYMQDLSAFFPVINPEVLQSMLGRETDNGFQGISKEIVEVCGAGQRKVSAHCFYSIAEQWGITNDVQLQQQAERLFLTRVRNAQRAPMKIDARRVQEALQSYPLDEKESQVITYYLNRGEIMLAYTRIQYHFPELKFEEINEKMKPVLGEQALQVQNTKNN